MAGLTSPETAIRVGELLSADALVVIEPEAGGSTMTTLFHGEAGLWPNQGGDSNQVPTVANGKVYVASNKQLRIFGLKATKKQQSKGAK